MRNSFPKSYQIQGTELRVGRLRLKLVAHEGHEARQLPETDDPEEPQEPQDPRRCTISLSTREGQDDVNGRDQKIGQEPRLPESDDGEGE